MKENQNNVKRYYRGLVLEEATKPLLLEPTQEDFDGAIPGDPEECVFARYARRALKAKVAVIQRGTAYISQGNKVLRYKIKAQAAASIQEFDAETIDSVLGVFVFDVPSPSQCLGHKKEYDLTKPVHQKPTQPRNISRGETGNWRLGIGKMKTSGGK